MYGGGWSEQYGGEGEGGGEEWTLGDITETLEQHCEGGGGGGEEVELKKGPWTQEEDDILREYIEKNGIGNWSAIQRCSGLARSGKSCRLRWTNHLRPHLRKGTFTNEEESLVVKMHRKHGNKWSRIAAKLPGRTDNEIKNFWNTRIKRRQRQGLPLYPEENTEEEQNPTNGGRRNEVTGIGNNNGGKCSTCKSYTVYNCNNHPATLSPSAINPILFPAPTTLHSTQLPLPQQHISSPHQLIPQQTPLPLHPQQTQLPSPQQHRPSSPCNFCLLPQTSSTFYSAQTPLSPSQTPLPSPHQQSLPSLHHSPCPSPRMHSAQTLTPLSPSTPPPQQQNQHTFLASFQHHLPQAPQSTMKSLTSTSFEPSLPAQSPSAEKNHFPSLDQSSSNYHSTLSLIDPTTVAFTPRHPPPLLSSPLGQFKRFRKATTRLSFPPAPPTQLSSSLPAAAAPFPSVPASSVPSLNLDSLPVSPNSTLQSNLPTASTSLHPTPSAPTPARGLQSLPSTSASINSSLQVKPMSLSPAFSPMFQTPFGPSFALKVEPPSIQLPLTAALQPTDNINTSWHRERAENNIAILEALSQEARERTCTNVGREDLCSPNRMQEHSATKCLNASELLCKIRRECRFNKMKTETLRSGSSGAEITFSGSLKTADLSGESLSGEALFSQSLKREIWMNETPKTDDFLMESLRREASLSKSSDINGVSGGNMRLEGLSRSSSETRDLLGKTPRRNELSGGISKAGIFTVESSREACLGEPFRKEGSLDQRLKKETTQCPKTDDSLLDQGTETKTLSTENMKKEGSLRQHSQTQRLLASYNEKPALDEFVPLHLPNSKCQSGELSFFQYSAEILVESSSREGSWDQKEGLLASVLSTQNVSAASQDQKSTVDGFCQDFSQGSQATILESGDGTGELSSVQCPAGEFPGEGLRTNVSLIKNLTKEGSWDQSLRGGLSCESLRESSSVSQEHNPLLNKSGPVFSQSPNTSPTGCADYAAAKSVSIHFSAESAKEKPQAENINGMPAELSSLLDFFPTNVWLPERNKSDREISNGSGQSSDEVNSMSLAASAPMLSPPHYTWNHPGSGFQGL